MAFVTLKGINDAVSNFAPRPGTHQDRLLSILSSYFSTEESIKKITSISSDELIRVIWDVDSQEKIQKKKKNLSSLKSAINKKFKELANLDQNPEGIIISKDNVFTISEEHKNSLLSKLGISSGSDPAMDFLASMRGLLGDLAEGGNSSRLQSMLSELDKTREIIDQLLQEKDDSPEEGSGPSEEDEGRGPGEGTGPLEGDEGRDPEEGTGPIEGDEGSGPEEIEEIELGENEEIIVIGSQQGDEGGVAPGTGDINGLEEDIDTELVDEDEILDEDIDTELVDEDEILDEDIDTEIVDEDEILETDINTELVDEDEILEEETVALSGSKPGSEKEEGLQGQQLDLSRYIEPSEALENLPETLTESTDELLNMIMQRFMPPFIQIPMGVYRVGCKKPKRMDRPEQNVTLKMYHISQIPVTNDIFDFFIRETGYETDAEKKGYGTVVEGRFSQKTDPETGRASLIINPGVRFQHVEGANWRHPKGPHSSLDNKASHPVVQVSRRDAIAFSSWAGKKIPSEDEWEAAARGNAGYLFPWGDEWLDNYGNFESSQIGDTTPVTHYGKEAMSPFGLLDMLGNVLEWTSSREVDAADKENTPRLSILKGGSWATGGIITAATRFLEGDDTWSNIIGFRCAV